MQIREEYSHNFGIEAFLSRGLLDWFRSLFEQSDIQILSPSSSPDISSLRTHLHNCLESEGWAFNVSIDAGSDLFVFAKKGDLVTQLQTGNISRYAYDLIKLQHLYIKKEIEMAVIAVPTKAASKAIGSNVANFDRISNELKIFNRIITVPLLVIGFE